MRPSQTANPSPTPDRLAARALPRDARRPRGPGGKAIGGLLPRITAKSFERYGFHSAEIITSWPVIAGKELANISVPERIRWPRSKPAETIGEAAPGATTTRQPRRAPPSARQSQQGDGATLFLRTEPAFALDIEYRAGEITDRINRYFGYRAIARIKVVQGPLVDSPTDRANAARPEPQRGATPERQCASNPVSGDRHDVFSALAGLELAIQQTAARR